MIKAVIFDCFGVLRPDVLRAVYERMGGDTQIDDVLISDTLYASHMNVAWAAQEEARRKAVLTPAEQNAGLAISYAIAGRSERQAKERLSCD